MIPPPRLPSPGAGVCPVSKPGRFHLDRAQISGESLRTVATVLPGMSLDSHPSAAVTHVHEIASSGAGRDRRPGTRSGHPYSESHMRVLIACEFSGTVRRAFRALGHDGRATCFRPRMAIDAICEAIVEWTGIGWDLLIAHLHARTWLSLVLVGGQTRPKSRKMRSNSSGILWTLLWSESPLKTRSAG